MELTVTRDPRAFALRTEAFLAQRAEHNLLATVLNGALDGHYAAEQPLFAYASDPDGAVRFAALRTPPWPLLSSALGPVGADELLDRWLADDPRLPAVNAPAQTARALARAWERRTGNGARCSVRTRLHALATVVDPPRPAPGALRSPRDGELGLLIAWWEAFTRETHVVDRPVRAEAIVTARSAEGMIFVWEDGGTAVSLVGVNQPVNRGVRIGPVYTPPEHRRRGYAGSAVAAVSRRMLARGARRCLLFTDLANPTSNKIYAEVGYRPIGDWEEHALTPAATK